MADQQHNQDKQSLSDISHLFLSSIRDRATGGNGARPQRTPPQSTQSSGQPVNSKSENRTEFPVDLTPEEFAQVIGGTDHDLHAAAASAGTASTHEGHDAPDRLPPISAVIAPHLNGHQRDRVREYAAHLCKTGERVGLIEIDASEFRVSVFELGSSEQPTESATCEALDGRRLAETLDEMSWDVDRWLLNVPNPRLTEARSILRAIDNWTVLATCDHDGVVACYRSLKGLAEAHDVAPTLSLALLDARDELAAMRVFRKLAGVCQQFLHWPLESESPVLAAGSVAEHQVLVCRATRDKAQLASAPQWQVVGDFVQRCKPGQRAVSLTPAIAPIKSQSPAVELREEPVAIPKTSAPVASPAPMMQVAPAINDSASSDSLASEVIDLPTGADQASAIVAATLRGATDVIECPVKPPMCSDASLAVNREKRLVLFAVAKQGLSDLRAIGEAWRWMNENRVLISMAMPQLSIDPHQIPHLRLLVDRADLSASTLQPLLQTGHVTVQTYRKLRWGPKTGLLLEAA